MPRLLVSLFGISFAFAIATVIAQNSPKFLLDFWHWIQFGSGAVFFIGGTRLVYALMFALIVFGWHIWRHTKRADREHTDLWLNRNYLRLWLAFATNVIAFFVMSFAYEEYSAGVTYSSAAVSWVYFPAFMLICVSFIASLLVWTNLIVNAALVSKILLSCVSASALTNYASMHSSTLWTEWSLGIRKLLVSVFSSMGIPAFVGNELYSINVDGFYALISPGCSGFEGMGMVGAMIGIFLYFERETLRLPQALLVIPLSIACSFLMNIVRLFLLFFIGSQFSAEFALNGFHSQIGWVFAAMQIFGWVYLVRRFSFFSAEKVAIHSVHESASARMLLPLCCTALAGLLTGFFHYDFDFFYPLRTIFVLAVVWWAIKGKWRETFRFDMLSVGVGLMSFGFWIFAFENFTDESIRHDQVIPTALATLPAWVANLWLGFRILGSALVVPIVEELAFRGYLMRRFCSDEIDRVSFQFVRPVAIIASSALFGFGHDMWIAAALVGVMYALIAKVQNELSGSVAAHSLTNALVAVYVLSTGSWGLW